jgi:hypothetical protein
MPARRRAAAAPPATQVEAAESIHCQLEADEKCPCGPRRGTGRNIPCRPDLAPQPRARTIECDDRAAAPQPAGPVALRAAAPLRLAAFEQGGVDADSAPLLLAQARDGSGAKLIVVNKRMVETEKNYLCVIRFLTVPSRNQRAPAFQEGTSVAAIKMLEDPLRRQIFTAMNNDPRKAFKFETLKAAVDNFDIRVAVIDLMNRVEQRCEYYRREDMKKRGPYIVSRHWEVVEFRGFGGDVGYAFSSKPPVKAHIAIADLAQEPPGEVPCRLPGLGPAIDLARGPPGDRR